MTRTLLVAFSSALLLLSLGCSSDAKKEPGKGTAEPASGLKELVKKDTKAGDGPELQKGDLAFVTYTGKLKNGTVFDSNDKEDANPLPVHVGEAGTIQGWIDGIPGMKLHGKRHLEIPSRLGYGPQGNGEKIPPNTDLYFDIEVIDVVRKGEENFVDKTDIKVGSGPTVAKGDVVQIHYKGTFPNGMRFDSTRERQKPEAFKVGAQEVISGLDFGVIGMKPGGVRKLRLPPEVAFGRGYNMIPSDMLIYMEVELLQLKKG